MAKDKCKAFLIASNDPELPHEWSDSSFDVVLGHLLVSNPRKITGAEIAALAGLTPEALHVK